LRAITSLDLHFLLPEFRKFIGARIQQIYQTEKNLRIELYSSELGKKELVFFPDRLFLSEFRRKAAGEPDMFGKLLRKRFEGDMVVDFRQKGFDRIIEMETKDYILIFEVFSKGNAILCDKSYQIVMPLEVQLWKDRTLKPQQQYLYPPSQQNILKMGIEEFRNALKSSEKEAVKFLAADLNLSGFYAEELLHRAHIDKNKLCRQLSDSEAYALFEAIQNVLKTSESFLVYDGEKLIDAIPIRMKQYESKILKSTSLAEAFDEYYSMEEGLAEEKKIREMMESKTGKLQVTLERQRESLSLLKAKEEESKRKGELIYNNFQLVQGMITVIEELRKQGMKWTQIKTEIMKELPSVRKVEEKKGMVTVELS